MAAVLVVLLLLLISFDSILSAIILNPFFRKYKEDAVMTEQQYSLYGSFVAFFLLDAAAFFLGVYWPLLVFLSLPLVIIPIQFIVCHRRYNPEVKAVPVRSKENHYYCPSIVSGLLGEKTTVIILMVASIVVFTTVFGMRMASLQRKFYRIDDRSDIVGIILSDDCIIAKKADDSSLKETYIIKVTDTSIIKEFESKEFYDIAHNINDSSDGFFFNDWLRKADQEDTSDVISDSLEVVSDKNTFPTQNSEMDFDE